MYFDTNTKNYLANYPYRTTEVAITLFNTKASFKQLLGVEREAVSIMSIEELTSNIEQLSYPGIYAIYCKVDGKFYIGGATVLKDRLYSHFCGVISIPNTHVKPSSNKPLQEALDMYGPANFQVIILHKFLAGLDYIRPLLGVYEEWYFRNVDNIRLYNVQLFSGFLRKTPKQDAVYINGKFIPKPIPVKIVDLTSPDFLSYKNYSSLYLAYHDLSVSKDRFYKLRKAANDKPFIMDNRWLVMVGNVY